MRILFMGTPAFAVPTLERLIEAGHTLCGVFSQPDKPKNRGMKLLPTPVKVCAQAHNIPDPELIVVAAYGRILPDDILNFPPKGCINVHSSLLPKYRGAAPIQWAVLNGDTETGVTIMHMATELDAGDIILQRSTPIGPQEDAGALYDRLALLGGALAVEAVAAIEAGTAVRTPQDHTAHTLAPMLSKDLSPVDWTRPAHAVHCQIRGLIPWPAASTELISGAPMKLFAAEETGEDSAAPAGTILRGGKPGIDVVCGDGKVLRLTELQPSGGKRMRAADYLRGHPLERGT